MSVAFRRESDEEHLEPRPELPIPPGPNLVTARGLAAIEARAAGLERDLDAAIAAGAEEAAIKAVRRELRYWHARRATARLAPLADGDEVAFGTSVRFRRGTAERRIGIVGDDEADPAAGLIAFSAPLVRALMGLGAGESAEFGGETLTVTGIEPLPADR